MRWDWTPHTRAKLATFLEARGLTRGDVTTQPIGDGHSNLTFLVSDGTRRVVVRRPPPPPTPPGAHDMLREARLIGALAGTAVPVPRLLATAGAGDVPLFNGIFPVMQAADVARIGYKGFKTGRPLIITGMINKMMAISGRLSPAFMAVRIAGRMNSKH